MKESLDNQGHKKCSFQWQSLTPKVILAALLFILLRCSSHLLADIETFGYFENRLFILGRKNISFTNINEKLSFGDYNRLRLQFKSSVSENISLNIAIDFFTFHGVIKSPLGIYNDQADTKPSLINLDRAYIDLYFPAFDVTVGKQRVAMGVSYIWAPLDLFNRVNIFEPKEEKPGVNALKIYIPLGKVSSLTGIFSPEDDFESSKSGLRAQTHFIGVDGALSLIYDGIKGETIYGIDLRGENIIGWWLEAGYFTSSMDDNLKIVLGFDYTFPFKRGIFWLNEFFFDESGEKDKALYDYNKLLAGERFTLGQKYYLSSLSYGFADFFSVSLTYIGNWTDGSFILSPGLQYEIAQNLSLRLGLFFLIGEKGGEFNRAEAFDIIYIWFKMHF